jgi:hypothetical protein
MNSKTRIKAALERKPVDKVPLGLYLVDNDTIAKVIGRPTFLRNPPAFHPAIWEGRRDEVAESMKRDLVDLFRKLDCVDLLTFKEAQILPPRGSQPEDPPKRIDATTFADSRGNVFKISPETNGISQVKFAETQPEPDMYSEEMFADRTLPAKPDESCFELLDHLIAHFGQDRFIAGYASGITAMTLLGGMEKGMMTLALQPEVVKACNRQKVFRQNYLDQFYIRKGVAGVHLEQDFGGTEAPLMSPGMFGELCAPFLKERIANVKKFVPKVLFHSCGNTMPLMDMILDCGIDAYESIQTNAKEISVRALAEKYGKKLCIWGAIPLEVLITGTPEDARNAVRRNFADAEKAEGFILGPSHSIAFGTKYENFMAMLDEFDKLRSRS